MGLKLQSVPFCSEPGAVPDVFQGVFLPVPLTASSPVFAVPYLLIFQDCIEENHHPFSSWQKLCTKSAGSFYTLQLVPQSKPIAPPHAMIPLKFLIYGVNLLSAVNQQIGRILLLQEELERTVLWIFQGTVESKWFTCTPSFLRLFIQSVQDLMTISKQR